MLCIVYNYSLEMLNETAPVFALTNLTKPPPYVLLITVKTVEAKIKTICALYREFGLHFRGNDLLRAEKRCGLCVGDNFPA